MKYYFVSYKYYSHKDSGDGRMFFKFDGPFVLRKIEVYLADKIGHETVLILFYKEITEEEFKLNS